MKLNVKAFAIAVALVWGLGIFIGTWWIIFLDGASSDMNVLGHIYRGYTITPTGSVIGMLWGLVDGLIGGAIFAWLYNLIVARM